MSVANNHNTFDNLKIRTGGLHVANRHNSLERIVHRASEEIHASRMIAKETSFSEGINAFRAKLDIQVMNITDIKNPMRLKHVCCASMKLYCDIWRIVLAIITPPMTMMRPCPLLPLIGAIRFGCAGGRDWILLLKL